jgi:hypothetical protein
MMATMRTHSLERTSPKGRGLKFVGTCVNCGVENLPAEAALWPCPNPDGVTQDDALIAAITRDSDEADRRGDDGRRQGMKSAATIEPYDAVRAGYANLITDMTREQLTHQAFFLHKLAWDRGEELRAANDRADNAEWDAARNRTLIDGHQMRYDALVETMRRAGAQLEAAERVIEIARRNRPMTVDTTSGATRCLDCGGINGHTAECPSGCQLAAIETYDATYTEPGWPDE